jgi:hypothetical protein
MGLTAASYWTREPILVGTSPNGTNSPYAQIINSANILTVTARNSISF